MMCWWLIWQNLPHIWGRFCHLFYHQGINKVWSTFVFYNSASQSTHHATFFTANNNHISANLTTSDSEQTWFTANTPILSPMHTHTSFTHTAPTKRMWKLRPVGEITDSGVCSRQMRSSKIGIGCPRLGDRTCPTWRRSQSFVFYWKLGLFGHNNAQHDILDIRDYP